MLTYNNHIMYFNGKWGDIQEPPPPPPPPIAANTVRLKLQPGATMSVSMGTAVLVDAENNIWDYTTDRWGRYNDLNEPYTQDKYIEWIGNNFDSCTSFDYCSSMANLTKANVTLPSDTTGMSYAFAGCTNLADLTLTGGGAITNLTYTYKGCGLLRHIPQLNYSNVNQCSYAFYDCVNIEDGILSTYNTLASSPNIGYHANCFTNCGSNTVTGAAELAQIPSDWKE